MAKVQEQAIAWIHQALKFDAAITDEIVARVPRVPLSLIGMPYCPAWESVLRGACGHCHMLVIVDFSMPDCPLDQDDMGHDCMVWYQAYNAIHTAQHMNKE